MTKAVIFMAAAAKYKTLKPTLEDRKPHITLNNSITTLITHFLRPLR